MARGLVMVPAPARAAAGRPGSRTVGPSALDSSRPLRRLHATAVAAVERRSHRGPESASDRPAAFDQNKKNLGLNEISEVLGHTFLKFIFFSKALLGVESVSETQLRHLLHLGLYLDKNADFVEVI